MRWIAKVAVRKSSLVLLAFSFLALRISCAKTPAPSQSQSLPQAVVTYGFMRWDYLGLEKLFSEDAALPVVKNLKLVDTALKSLDCDVPSRLASPHKATILPTSPISDWIGFPAPNASDDGWLFVTQSLSTVSQRIVVVLSSAAPERTTVFWVEDDPKAGYAAQLIYDSLKKGKISNAATIIGTVIEIRAEEPGYMFLKDRGEPGVGPNEFARVGRVFRLNLSRETVALISSATREAR